MQYAKSTGGSIFSPVIQDRIVPGYYTSTTVDTQGHIINKNSMIAALEDYRQWGGIREMHNNPIGVIESIGEPSWNAIRARVVNTARGDEVLQYVHEGVYKAFSIGALVTGGRMIPFKEVSESLFVDVPAGIVRSIKEYGYILEIMELVLVEVSIVDRPANPVARISEVKNFGGVDTSELPSIYNPIGHDALKGMFPISDNKFFVSWDGTEHADEEKALDNDTEETQVMNENTEVVTDEVVDAVEPAVTEVVETEKDITAATEEVVVAEIEVSIDADEPVLDAVLEVADSDLRKSLARVENMLVALSESVAKAIESLRSDLEKKEAEVPVVETEKSIAPVDEEFIDMIAGKVQEKIIAPRKGIVQTADKAAKSDVPQATSLKGLDLAELRNRIVTTLAQTSK